MLKSTIIRPNKKQKSQNRVIWPQKGQVTNPETIVIWLESFGMQSYVSCEKSGQDMTGHVRTGLSYMLATKINNKKLSRGFRRRLGSVDKSKMYIFTFRIVP
jgi:hypothetical protein